MSDVAIDPRLLNERPVHWYDGCTAQLGDEWVAMSELMIGPEHVGRDDDGRVADVSLAGRRIGLESDDQFCVAVPCGVPVGTGDNGLR